MCIPKATTGCHKGLLVEIVAYFLNENETLCLSLKRGLLFGQVNAQTCITHIVICNHRVFRA